jgi:hypothetical protein
MEGLGVPIGSRKVFRIVWLFGIVGTLANPWSSAQQSDSFELGEHVFNAGGHPEQGSVPASGGFRISLDAIGDVTSGPTPSSASYRVAGGFVTAYSPPGEVLELRFDDGTTLSWHPERSVGSYMLYRDGVDTLAGDYGSCLEPGITIASTNDSDTPVAGIAWFYLVTARNRLGEEGTKGFAGDGTERGNTAPCP